MGYRHWKYISWGVDIWEILHYSKDWFWFRGCHIVIVAKEICGLSSSGIWLHEGFYGCLRDMLFFPYNLKPDILMWHNREICEYIYMYVDDLVIVSSHYKTLMDALENRYRFKLKGTGKIEFHLGWNLFCDSNVFLCFAPHNYIDNMDQTYVNVFGSNPKLNKAVRSPLE